ncbi:MAG: hypothetical protein R3304_06010 [Longimicrobiales bacterium]|nr:hypothetical protein [Longimicrobiales bacterium]
MNILATKKAEQNRAVLDPWTIVHFASGLASGLVNAPLRATLPLAALYEVAEYVLESRELGQELFDTSGPETLPNAIVDVAVFAIGHELGRRWNDTGG